MKKYHIPTVTLIEYDVKDVITISDQGKSTNENSIIYFELGDH